MHCTGEMLLDSLEHALPLPTVYLRDLADVRIDVIVGQELVDNELRNGTCVQISCLLGHQQLVDHMVGSNKPAEPKAGGNDLRKRPQQNSTLRKQLFEEWFGLAFIAQFTVRVIFDKYC